MAGGGDSECGLSEFKEQGLEDYARGHARVTEMGGLRETGKRWRRRTSGW